jgi:hypothetical protein
MKPRCLHIIDDLIAFVLSVDGSPYLVFLLEYVVPIKIYV